MKDQISCLNCGEPIKASLKNETDEVVSVVELIESDLSRMPLKINTIA